MMKSRMGSLFEVALVFVLIRLFLWGWSITPAAQLEWNILRWPYFGHTVYTSVSILVLFFAKRSFKSYGLNLAVNWKAGLKWGLLFGGALAAPSLVALIFGWQKIDVPKLWLSTLVFQMFFASFGEEILYRGYYQSRLNDSFGRPRNADGLRFGTGLIVISLLFGFAHVLNPYNPLQGRYALDWFAGLVALQTGVFYGFVREKTGSILASAIIHGSTFWWDFLGEGSARYISMSVGWSISWVILFVIFSRIKLENSSDVQGQEHA